MVRAHLVALCTVCGQNMHPAHFVERPLPSPVTFD
jgi:hypothetical protein